MFGSYSEEKLRAFTKIPVSVPLLLQMDPIGNSSGILKNDRSRFTATTEPTELSRTFPSAPGRKVFPPRLYRGRFVG